MDETKLPDKITADTEIKSKAGYSFKELAPGAILRKRSETIPLRLIYKGYPTGDERGETMLFIADDKDGEAYVQENLTSVLRDKIRTIFSNFNDLRQAYKGSTGKTLRKWDDWNENITDLEVWEFWESYAKTQGKTSIGLLTSLKSNAILEDGYALIMPQGTQKDNLTEVEPNLWMFEKLKSYSIGLSGPFLSRGWYGRRAGGVAGQWDLRLFKDDEGYVLFPEEGTSTSFDNNQEKELLAAIIDCLEQKVEANRQEAIAAKAGHSYSHTYQHLQIGAAEVWLAEQEITFNLTLGDNKSLMTPVARYKTSIQWENGSGLKSLAKDVGLTKTSKMNVEELREAVAEATSEAASNEEIPAGFVLRNLNMKPDVLEALPYLTRLKADAVVAGTQKLGKFEGGFLHPSLPLVGQRLVNMRYPSGYICQWLNPYTNEDEN